jgi:hypothetical protein
VISRIFHVSEAVLSSFVKYILESFAHFKHCALSLFLISWSSLHILEISPLLHICIVTLFSVCGLLIDFVNAVF